MYIHVVSLSSRGTSATAESLFGIFQPYAKSQDRIQSWHKHHDRKCICHDSAVAQAPRPKIGSP